MKRQILLLVALFFTLAVAAQTAVDTDILAKADWKTTTLRKGLVCKTAVFDTLYGVPQEIAILEVSPRHYKFDVQEHNGMEPTSKVSARENAIASMNGTFYNMKHGFSVSYLQQRGTVIDTTSTGVTQSNGALYITKHGKIKVIPWDKETELKYIRRPRKLSMMAAGPLMLQDGEACDLSMCNRSFVENKHPRSGVVLTKDKKVLLIVVDGRRKGKCEGVSIAEFIHLAKFLGGVDALNLDGGGSSTLWSKDLPEDGIINTPSDKSGERHVANSLGVYAK